MRRRAARRCPSCGYPVPANASFCGKCGASLAPRGKPGEAGIPTFADKYNGYAKILGILSIFIFGWILGPLAIYYGSRARALDPRKGTGGIVLGAIGIVIWIIGVILFW